MKEINFFNQYQYSFKIPKKKQLSKALLFILSKETTYKHVQINIILLTDEDLLTYNKTFLQHDYYTDIITFPIESTEELLEAELYISVDRVIDNALQNKVKTIEEFKRVLIHGVLHLCGYNDKTKAEIKTMRQKENHYLQSECFT